MPGREEYSQIDYVCDLSAIPVDAKSFDCVIFTQVLEHLPDPASVLRELQRVLVPGGALYLSAPLFYAEHEQPYDFYRYTQFGLRYLLEKAGFTIEQLDWLEGYFGTLSYQLETASSALPRRPKDYGGGSVGVLSAAAFCCSRPAFGLLSRLLARADLKSKWTRSGQCKNYRVLARKPAAPAS